MAVTYKDIDLLTKKSAVAGTEKLPVSDTEYITPDQVVGKLYEVKSLDGLTLHKRYISASGQWVSYSGQYPTGCVLLPITPGKTYQVHFLTQGIIAVLAESSPKASGDVMFATGFDGRINREAGEVYEFTAPSDAVSIYFILSSGAGVPMNYEIYQINQLGLAVRMLEQVLTSAQKTQARTNIGAAAAADINNVTITIRMNGADIDSFTVNQSSDKTIDLGGNFLKYVLCADEAAYNSIQNKDSGTLYLIPESS